MIRINLLPAKRKKRIKGITYFFIALASITAAAILILVSITYFLKSDISKLKSRSEANKTKMATLAKKIEEAKRYEQLNKEIEQRSSIIEGLRRNQLLPAKLLNNVSITLPDGVWLISLSYKDSGVDIEGYGFTNFDIVSYVDNLKKTEGFEDVTLIESREAEVEKTRVYKFKIIFKVKV